MQGAPTRAGTGDVGVGQILETEKEELAHLDSRIRTGSLAVCSFRNRLSVD